MEALIFQKSDLSFRKYNNPFLQRPNSKSIDNLIKQNGISNSNFDSRRMICSTHYGGHEYWISLMWVKLNGFQKTTGPLNLHFTEWRLPCVCLSTWGQNKMATDFKCWPAEQRVFCKKNCCLWWVEILRCWSQQRNHIPGQTSEQYNSKTLSICWTI